MQTTLAPEYQNTPDGQAAEAILRKCVHCGFCTATCPTYQLLGDELDGPRGRTTSTTFQELAKQIDDFLRSQMPVWRVDSVTLMPTKIQPQAKPSPSSTGTFLQRTSWCLRMAW